MSDHREDLTEEQIRKYLTKECENLRLFVLSETDSTNTLLKKKAEEGTPEGSVVIAGAQTKGKGRLGRKFYSPAGTGVYLSLLLRPEDLSPEQAVKVTTIAAVAGCEAIETVSGRKAQIKWVNDIYIEEKKVCGILAEASMGSHNAKFTYIVLGIGFNVFSPEKGFPEEIKSVAGSIFSEKKENVRNLLAAEFLNHFFSYFYLDSTKNYVEEYRRRCFVIGKEVYVLTSKEKKRAQVLDVDQECHLVVRYEEGKVEHLSSGEISIRPVGRWG